MSMLCLLYGGLTAGYVLARLIIGERWSLVELANSLMPNPLLPLFIAVPILLVLRRWRWSLIYAPAVILFTVQYSPLLLPNPAASVEAPHLRVLTYNLGSVVEDAEHTADVIRAADAHIVALQELLSPVALRFQRELADLYPYHALHPTDNYARGVGLLSKYPILDDVYLDQIVLGGQQTRIALAAGTTITVLNVHPVAPAARLFGLESALRSQEISYALDRAAQVTDPLLLGGRFQHHRSNRRLCAHRRPLWRCLPRQWDRFRRDLPQLHAFCPPFTLAAADYPHRLRVLRCPLGGCPSVHLGRSRRFGSLSGAGGTCFHGWAGRRAERGLIQVYNEG
ncbi:MAG: hypothetical protein IPK17_14430 [Chloroflexi bacterium]|nr:hypothetical protein [Chloroflexota bacterium]